MVALMASGKNTPLARGAITIDADPVSEGEYIAASRESQ
jgi:hypothetical protein